VKTPLQRASAAASEGNIAEYRTIVAENPDVLAQGGVGHLATAAGCGHLAMVEYLASIGVDLNGSSYLGTPLTAVARKGTPAMAQWLLDHGAEIDRSPDDGRDNPLFAATVENRVEMVEFLLDRGANPDALYGNRNVMAYARFWRKDAVIAALERRGIEERVIADRPVDVESESFLVDTEILSPSEWHSRKWVRLLRHVEAHGLDTLSEKNKVFFLVGYLIDQICDGGVDSVYANPSAGYVTLMPEALEKIGATGEAEVIRQLNALFPGGAPSDDYRARQKQLRSLRKPMEKLGERLEALFDEWSPDGSERRLVVQAYDHWHKPQ
jgi:hypothetical protein